MGTDTGCYAGCRWVQRTEHIHINIAVTTTAVTGPNTAASSSTSECSSIHSYNNTYYKNKIHSSCEIEDFVQTHLCKLCDTSIARITGCVCKYSLSM